MTFARRVKMPLFEINSSPTINLGDVRSRRFGDMYVFTEAEELIFGIDHITYERGISGLSTHSICGKKVKGMSKGALKDTDYSKKGNLCRDCFDIWETKELVEG